MEILTIQRLGAGYLIWFKDKEGKTDCHVFKNYDKLEDFIKKNKMEFKKNDGKRKNQNCF